MCAGGGQTPLLPINRIQSSFLSLRSSLGSWNVCLAFPKTGCLLGVNHRDTLRPERPSDTCTSVYMLSFGLCTMYMCSFVPMWKTISIFCSFAIGCNICHAKIWNHFLLTDQPQYHVATDHPAWSVVRIYCQTAYSCHFSVGLNRLPVGLM